MKEAASWTMLLTFNPIVQIKCLIVLCFVSFLCISCYIKVTINLLHNNLQVQNILPSVREGLPMRSDHTIQDMCIYCHFTCGFTCISIPTLIYLLFNIYMYWQSDSLLVPVPTHFDLTDMGELAASVHTCLDQRDSSKGPSTCLTHVY